MSEQTEKHKIVAGRRSSLKTQDMSLDPAKLAEKKNKRNSVSWGQSNTFQFKAMKAMFQESVDLKKLPKEEEQKHQEFVENRRKSIKNEFSLVKEMLAKNKNIIEEEEDDANDEVKKNTDKNVKIGHNALNDDEESCSSSSEENQES